MYQKGFTTILMIIIGIVIALFIIGYYERPEIVETETYTQTITQ